MKRRNVSALAGGLVAILIATTAVYAGLSTNAASEKQEAVSTAIAAAGNKEEIANVAAESAGISAYLENTEALKTVSEKTQAADKTGNSAAAAAAAESQNTAAAAAKQKEKALQWENRAIASNVQEYVYVRAEASEDSAPVGKLPRGGAGDVIEKGQEWTRISSGDVDGYVNNAYLAFDEEALQVAEAVCDYVATVEADQVSIREEPGADAQILKTVSTGETYEVVEQGDDWVKVVSDQCVGYMSKIVVDVKLDTAVATPVEQTEKAPAEETEDTSEKEETSKDEEADSQENTEAAPEKEPTPANEPEEETPAREATAAGAASHSGTFRVTAYCSCSKCCGSYANGITATGTKVTAGRTIAVDKNIIPLGTTVYINGVPYVAEDTGVHGKTIDLYMDSHAAALQWGVQYCTVTW